VAGLPYGAATNVQQAFESMFKGRARDAAEWGDHVRTASRHRGPWPRVSIWQGDADATVVPLNAEALVAQWTNLHGIDTAPRHERIDGYPRRTWRRDGIDLIESFTITGMAHGTPLATGRNGCGKAGPFLLEAGISSSDHIASFFGLTGTAWRRATASAQEARIVTAPPVADDVVPDDRVEILGRDETPKGRIDVMAVITKALTSAGLMKPPR
jgi:poly(3-hydroxybutyrate) depolymerase